MQPMKTRGSSDLTGDIYLRRKEFVSNVFANGVGTSQQAIQSTFNVQTFNINAGLAATFPWLSQVAKNFTFYEFEQLIFEYKPLSGEYGNLNTNALGKVVMSTQYDPDAPNFQSSIQMENYDWTTSQKPSEHGLHGVECKRVERSTNQLYVRVGASAKDEVLTDLGDFQIATEGIPLTIPNGATSSTVPIGELWVMYTVKLSRANIYNSTSGGGGGVDVHFGSTTGAANWGSNTITFMNATPLSAQYYVTPTNAAAVQYAAKRTNAIGTWAGGRNTTSNMVIFPPGTNGNFFIYFAIEPNASETNGFTTGPPTLGAAADLQFAAVSGYIPPSGTIGALAVATAAQVTISPNVTGAGGTYESKSNNLIVPATSATSGGSATWAVCGVSLVQIQTSAQQVAVLLFSTTNATTTGHNAESMFWIFQTPLNSTF